MKSALAAVVVCALVLTSTPCLTQKVVGGESTAIAEGLGGFAKGGNFFCMGRGCDGLDVDNERYSFTEAAVAGKAPKGAGKSQARTREVESDARAANKMLTGSLSAVEGKGHLSNMGSASLAQILPTDTVVDPRTQRYYHAVTSSMLRGGGLAKGAAAIQTASAMVFTNPMFNLRMAVSGGVKGGAGGPRHSYHQPAVLAQYVDFTREAGTGDLGSGPKQGEQSDSYINGYKSQAFGMRGGTNQNLGVGALVRSNAEGSSLASASISLPLGSIPNPTMNKPVAHLFSKPGNQAFASGLRKNGPDTKECEIDGVVQSNPNNCNQDTPSWLEGHTNPFVPITSASESGQK